MMKLAPGAISRMISGVQVPLVLSDEINPK